MISQYDNLSLPRTPTACFETARCTLWIVLPVISCPNGATGCSCPMYACECHRRLPKFMELYGAYLLYARQKVLYNKLSPLYEWEFRTCPGHELGGHPYPMLFSQISLIKLMCQISLLYSTSD